MKAEDVDFKCIEEISRKALKLAFKAAEIRIEKAGEILKAADIEGAEWLIGRVLLMLRQDAYSCAEAAENALDVLWYAELAEQLPVALAGRQMLLETIREQSPIPLAS